MKSTVWASRITARSTDEMKAYFKLWLKSISERNYLKPIQIKNQQKKAKKYVDLKTQLILD